MNWILLFILFYLSSFSFICIVCTCIAAFWQLFNNKRISHIKLYWRDNKQSNDVTILWRVTGAMFTGVWMMWLCRCCHVTDIGIGYLSTMTSLCRLYLRWCTLLRDFGLQHLYTMKNLTALSLAGTSRQPQPTIPITNIQHSTFKFKSNFSQLKTLV